MAASALNFSSVQVVPTASPTGDIVVGEWDDTRQQYAAGSASGHVEVWEASDQGSGAWTLSSKWQAYNDSIHSFCWTPLKFGRKLAVCSSANGVSIWAKPIPEEDSQNSGALTPWELCVRLPKRASPTLSMAMGSSPAGRLLLVTASADGWLRVFEENDTLKLKEWQLQTEFPFISATKVGGNRCFCNRISLSWSPLPGQGQTPLFLLGSQGNYPGSNTAQVFQQSEVFNMWKNLASLSKPDEADPAVYDVSWAPNSGRPDDFLALAVDQSLHIWRLNFETLGVEREAILKHGSKVLQVAWDLGGLRVASVGIDGIVRLWRNNFDGKWEEFARVEK